jgi:hypothetical protein
LRVGGRIDDTRCHENGQFTEEIALAVLINFRLTPHDLFEHFRGSFEYDKKGSAPLRG